MFDTVLVANRGEIAVRVFRTLREMGIASIAVYSDVDRDAVFVRHADEAYRVGPGPAADSYLRVDRILEVAARSGAQAIHPGYGFLAENAGFARAAAEAGVTFIGPPPEAIDAMGSKIAARALMAAAGVPIVPGVTEPVDTVDDAASVAEQIGYPVAVKAAAGGGGKGFRVARGPGGLADAFEGARRESERFFADSVLYLERYLPQPRHVEVQVLADGHGNCVWLGDRDCSVQRRHQKLVEETPSPVLDDELRQRMGDASVLAARAVDYRSAGTLEYLVSGGEFFFLEMNTRIQVEHTITEAVTGVDLVREQVRVAAGEPLSMTQDEIRPRGHAFECRINAEDATRRFLPAPARITGYREPAGPGVRVDSGVEGGSEIPEIYDPMVAKLIAWDTDRDAARRRMLRALGEYRVEGPATLIPFHRWLFQQPDFIAGGACHAEIARLEAENTPLDDGAESPAPEAPALDDRPLAERSFVAEVDGRRFDVLLRYPSGDSPAGAPAPAKRAKRTPRADSSAGADDNTVTTPMQGTLLRLLVEVGQKVAEGDVVCIVEAMKMENEVMAHRSATIAELHAAEGDAVEADQVIATID